MITIKPFNGWRPNKNIADKVASPPYDVLSSEEARVLCGDNPNSFLKIIKPEVDFTSAEDSYSQKVYDHGKSNWNNFKKEGVFVQDETPSIYFYRQFINGHGQTGIVAASAIDDYFEDRIKKHEFTRPKKENDRIAHMKTLGVHPGPVFLTYKHEEELDNLIGNYTKSTTPENDFTAEDGVRHTLLASTESRDNRANSKLL